LASFPHTIFFSDRLAPIREAVFDFIAALKGAIAGFGGRVVLIASVDFAHVGVKYGDERPPTPGELTAVRERDKRTIEIISAGDRDRFLQDIASDDDKRRICGFPAIYTMLSVLEGSRGRLLCYDSTVMDNSASTVTFASMVFGGARTNGACTRTPGGAGTIT
jgi:AmmeMemoRadiSam system protein B